MKKAFMLFVVLVSLIVETSCSNSSNPETPIVEKSLTLTSNKTEVEIGEEVDFIIKVDHEVVNDATLFVNNEKISNPFHFKEAGTYTVIAKKDKFKDSNILVIKVKGSKPNEKMLILSANRATFYEGETVKFTVKDNNNQEVFDAVIKLNGTPVGSSWVAKSPGSYNFIASKEGYTDSQEIKIVVQDDEMSSSNYFIYKEKRYDLDKASFQYIGEKLGDGGIYDIYRMDLYTENTAYLNVINVNVEFKRTVESSQTYPRNGQFLCTPFVPFVLTTWSGTWVDAHTDANSYVELSNIYRKETAEQYVKVVKNGKINFKIWTMAHGTLTKEKIEGEYGGEIFIYTNK